MKATDGLQYLNALRPATLGPLAGGAQQGGDIQPTGKA